MDLPDWIPKEEWDAWLEMRKKIKKPATEFAQKIAIKKLDGWRLKGHNIQEILENSILGSWQGLFEPIPKKNQIQPEAPRLDSVDRTRNLIESYDRPSNRGSTGYEAFKAATQRLKH